MKRRAHTASACLVALSALLGACEINDNYGYGILNHRDLPLSVVVRHANRPCDDAQKAAPTLEQDDFGPEQTHEILAEDWLELVAPGDACEVTWVRIGDDFEALLLQGDATVSEYGNAEITTIDDRLLRHSLIVEGPAERLRFSAGSDVIVLEPRAQARSQPIASPAH
jgi:hypothetical protein